MRQRRSGLWQRLVGRRTIVTRLVRSVAVAHGGTAEILGGPGAAVALTVDAPQVR